MQIDCTCHDDSGSCNYCLDHNEELLKQVKDIIKKINAKVIKKLADK